MTKKPASCTQVRINGELAREIDQERADFGITISRPAFIETLLHRGLKAHREAWSDLKKKVLDK